MRLSKSNIEKISELITRSLIDKKLVTLKTQREKLAACIKETIVTELMKEDALDKEAAALIEKNIGAAGRDSIDYQKMFNMVKAKLAKEKGVIL